MVKYGSSNLTRPDRRFVLWFKNQAWIRRVQALKIRSGSDLVNVPCASKEMFVGFFVLALDFLERTLCAVRTRGAEPRFSGTAARHHSKTTF